jgi:hypothetical protein
VVLVKEVVVAKNKGRSICDAGGGYGSGDGEKAGGGVVVVMHVTVRKCTPVWYWS